MNLTGAWALLLIGVGNATEPFENQLLSSLDIRNGHISVVDQELWYVDANSGFPELSVSQDALDQGHWLSCN